MRLLINQMMKCAELNLFYPAIITACTIPDICGALDSNGEADGGKYIRWWDKYAARYYNNDLKGYEAYHLRCAILHQGRVTHKDINRYEAIGFIEANSPFQLGINKSPHIFFIQVPIHCNYIGQAVEDWLSKVENTKTYQENYQKFFKRASSINYSNIFDIPLIIAT